jgi:hypothetical protein
MSESVQRDDQWSSFHDMVHFRYDEQRPALHAGGLTVLYYTLCTQVHPKVNGIPLVMEQCGVDCESMLFWPRNMV